MVGGDKLNHLAVDAAAKIGDRHLDRFRTRGAIHVGIHARHVGDKTNTYCVVRYLSLCSTGQTKNRGNTQCNDSQLLLQRNLPVSVLFRSARG